MRCSTAHECAVWQSAALTYGVPIHVCAKSCDPVRALEIPKSPNWMRPFRRKMFCVFRSLREATAQTGGQEEATDDEDGMKTESDVLRGARHCAYRCRMFFSCMYSSAMAI